MLPCQVKVAPPLRCVVRILSNSTAPLRSALGAFSAWLQTHRKKNIPFLPLLSFITSLSAARSACFAGSSCCSRRHVAPSLQTPRELRSAVWCAYGGTLRFCNQSVGGRFDPHTPRASKRYFCVIPCPKVDVKENNRKLLIIGGAERI